MAKIFISYRRDDSAYATGVIRDQLVRQLPDCEVFLDVDSIPYGVDFRQHLEDSVGACDYLVAVIGKRWLTVVDKQGERRIDDPNDAVRVEVETALNREIPLIPVFLDGMDVPPPDQLPQSLRNLVARNAIFVRPPPDFNRDVDRLVQAFQRWLDQAAPPRHGVESSRAAPTAARGKLAIGLIAALALAALGAWWYRSSAGAPAGYTFAENYLFEDSNPMPSAWRPHSRMIGGGFHMPLEFVHWVVRLEHPPGMRPRQVTMECRLLDES